MSLRKSMNSSRERGQALVEAALTITAFLGIFLGVIEVGQILFVHQTLVERTREAVRWAAVNSWDDTATPPLVANMVLYGTTSPPDGAQPVFGLSSSNVTATRPQPDWSSNDRIVVTVSGYALTFVTNSFVQGMSGHAQSTPSSQITGLTIQETLPYEVSNGSSH